MGQYQRGGTRKNQKIAPKPYAYIPLPDKVTRRSPTGHHRFHKNHISGKIIGTIEALSPIHIGSGIIDLAENVGITDQSVDLTKTAMRRVDKIVIPGSSLKGAIRSVVEAISESCVSKTVKKVRDAFPTEYKFFNECQQDNLCVACRMFGAMGFQGNIAIQDAQHIEGQIVTKLIPPLYRPRRFQKDEVKNLPMRRFYMHGEVAIGKTPIEACDVGSKFQFSVHIDNLKKSEWGLLFTALGHHPEYLFKLKIGGAKPVCFGSVDFKIDEIHVEKQTPDGYLDWDFNRVDVKKDNVKEDWVKDCITEATNSLIQINLLEMLAEILEFPNTRQCPQPPWTY